MKIMDKVKDLFKEKPEKNQRIIEEKDLVSYVDEKVKSGSNPNFERQCYINVNYYSGKQHIAWDKVQKRIIEPPKEKPWKTRYTANKIQPLVRTERAKILKNKPVMFVVPEKTDDDSIRKTKVAEQVIEWLESELKLQSRDSKLVLWGCVCSIGFAKPFWNDGKGLTLIDPETREEIKQGDIDFDVVNPLEIEWDPTAEYWEDVQWVCHKKARDVKYIKDKYGKEVAPEDNLMNSNLMALKLDDINSGTPNKLKNSAIVKEYWEKPSSEYPKGRTITVANGKLLYYDEDIGFGEEDDSERELPFFPFVHIDVPGKIEGTCVVEQTIPVQREYNTTRGQIIDNKNLMGSPVWTMEENSLLNGEPVNAPDYVAIYRAGHTKPSMEQPPSMSADVYKNLEMCDSEFEFISGQHETSNGMAPAGVKSGVAIGYLQEQDDTKLGPTISNFISCKIAYTKYLLKIIRYKYDIERTIKIVGKNKQLETVTFKGSDITSMDVRIQEGSMFQMSTSAKRDFIMALVDKGLIKDPTQALKMLDLGISDDLYDDYSIDLNDAQEENDKWKKGDPNTPVKDFDNHAVHIQEHNKFRKSTDYTDMPPEIQRFIDEHVKVHQNFIAQIQAPPIQPVETGTPVPGMPGNMM